MLREPVEVSMSDFACCLDDMCPIKDNCLRFVLKASSPYQLYADFRRKEESCEYHLPLFQRESSAKR